MKEKVELTDVECARVDELVKAKAMRAANGLSPEISNFSPRGHSSCLCVTRILSTLCVFQPPLGASACLFTLLVSGSSPGFALCRRLCAVRMHVPDKHFGM